MDGTSFHKASPLPQRFARIRVAVGFLGQRELGGWWTSSFLSSNGLAVAQYNFPRAAGYAAVSATVAAAKLLHDERIGKRRCVHLFRLGLVDEALVQRALQSSVSGVLDDVAWRLDNAIELLEAEAGEIISVEPGPVQVGTTADAFTETGLVELAKHYLGAFRQDIQCLPYFAAPKR